MPDGMSVGSSFFSLSRAEARQLGPHVSLSDAVPPEPYANVSHILEEWSKGGERSRSLFGMRLAESTRHPTHVGEDPTPNPTGINATRPAPEIVSPTSNAVLRKIRSSQLQRLDDDSSSAKDTGSDLEQLQHDVGARKQANAARMRGPAAVPPAPSPPEEDVASVVEREGSIEAQERKIKQIIGAVRF